MKTKRFSETICRVLRLTLFTVLVAALLGVFYPAAAKAFFGQKNSTLFGFSSVVSEACGFYSFFTVFLSSVFLAEVLLEDVFFSLEGNPILNL